MGQISTGNLKVVLLCFSFQLNGKFWQPSQLKSLPNQFKKCNIFSKVGFFNPVKQRRRRSHSAQVRCYIFFLLRRKKYSNNLTSGRVLFSEQLSTVFHFCFFFPFVLSFSLFLGTSHSWTGWHRSCSSSFHSFETCWLVTGPVFVAAAPHFCWTGAAFSALFFPVSQPFFSV